MDDFLEAVESKKEEKKSEKKKLERIKGLRG